MGKTALNRSSVHIHPFHHSQHNVLYLPSSINSVTPQKIILGRKNIGEAFALPPPKVPLGTYRFFEFIPFQIHENGRLKKHRGSLNGHSMPRKRQANAHVGGSPSQYLLSLSCQYRVSLIDMQREQKYVSS